MKKIAIFLLLTTAFLYAEEEAIKELLLTKDDRSYKYHDTITYIARANMGIPGRESWLVRWSGKYGHTIILYAINTDEIVNRIIGFSDFDLTKETEYDIMKEIPGKRIGDGVSAIADFNNDGIDELFSYGFFGAGYRVIIVGYDKDSNELRYFCKIPFDLVDKTEGPAPVEFLEYKGMKGFKVYYDLYYGTPMNPPQNIINEYYAWYFFAWDEASQEFIEVCEYLEEEKTVEAADKAEFSNETPSPTTASAPEPEPVMTVTAKPSPLIFVIIGIGAAVVIIIMVLVIRRKKP